MGDGDKGKDENRLEDRVGITERDSEVSGVGCDISDEDTVNQKLYKFTYLHSKLHALA